MLRPWLWLGLVVCLGPVTGCSGGKAPPKMVQVSGTVKLDDKPLDEGDITFIGEPGTIPTALPVTGGAFSGSVQTGKLKVEIRAYEYKKAPPTSTAGAVDMKENYLPDKYNVRTTLSAEVTEQGLNPSTFEVKKK